MRIPRAAVLVAAIVTTVLLACTRTPASAVRGGPTTTPPPPDTVAAAASPAATMPQPTSPAIQAATPSPSPATATASATRLTRSRLLRRSAVPTTAECVAAGLVPCYTPAQVRAAYNIQPLIDSGTDGSGVGVVIVDSFGSPRLVADVAAFSDATGLPPADIQELYPLGQDFGDADPNEVTSWGGETTLDAEWVHAIAPGARITVLVSPVDELEGVQGMPEFRQLEEYALEHQLGSVISQSWGTTENFLTDQAGAAERAAWDDLYKRATAMGVTIVSASGDHGALADTPSGGIGHGRAVDWPASEPDVTAVGGTALTLNADGTYDAERVWRDSGDASGGGVSAFYQQPAAQAALPQTAQSQLNGMRGLPDVSALASGLIVYYATGGESGGHPDITGGTSAAAPIWAGIVALADQAAGGGLGDINPTLYSLGVAGRCFHDVTEGDSALREDPGYAAGPGWDLPTGWGTPDAGCLVPALAAAAPQQQGA